MINANLIINGAKRRAAFPTAGLQAIVYDQTYEDGGTTYYRTSLGIGLPVISGTGLDTIIDFSPLNDTRFDKGSYVGNAFGLPEYYNFPYVGIYYDATSEATRYHWKITDFGYAVILAQSLLVDNMFFLKAKATIDTSNVITSWGGLYIYSTALVNANLLKIQKHINIFTDINTAYNDYYQDVSVDNVHLDLSAFSGSISDKTGKTLNNTDVTLEQFAFKNSLKYNGTSSFLSLANVNLGKVHTLHLIGFGVLSGINTFISKDTIYTIRSLSITQYRINGTSYNISSILPSVNDLFCFSIVRNQKNIKTYINGELVNETNIADADNLDMNLEFIGKRAGLDDLFYNGYMHRMIISKLADSLEVVQNFCDNNKKIWKYFYKS